MPLIVGGGPAGAAAAIRLAQAGMAPVIVERTAVAADVLCGGFLSWNSVELLHRCHVDPQRLGGHAIRRARIFAGKRIVELALPATAMGLSRRRLDAALLHRAEQAGVQIRRGIAVRAIEGGIVRYADGTSETPDCLILASGKQDVRGAARPAVSDDPAVGLRWRFRASERLVQMLDDAIELHLFRQGYAGLLMQEDGAANLCLAVRQSAFSGVGRRPDAMLAAIMADIPGLSERLACISIGKAQAIANIPYGWRARGGTDHLYRVGDQAAVIPSLVGEGVGIALATGIAAADAIIAGVAPQPYQAACSRQIALPIGFANLLWSLAERPVLAGPVLALLATLPSVGSLAMRMTRAPMFRPVGIQVQP